MTEVVHDESGVRSIVPGNYDAEFILSEAGNPNHSGWMENEDGTKLIVYHPNDHALMIETIEAYPATYLEKVAKPAARKRIGEIGRAKAREFTFGGMPLMLDQGTEARITSAVTYIERNPSVTELHWDTTGEGAFVTLDRATALALGDAAGAHVQAVFNQRKMLTDQVNATTTLAELDAVDLEAGWPV